MKVVVEGLHLIAKHPHHPYIFGYQYCCVFLRETVCDGRLSRAGFAAEKMKGWRKGHEATRESVGEA